MYPTVLFGDDLIEKEHANLSIASSAVLYGLSVYTVFHVAHTEDGYYGFRMRDHYNRLIHSCKIIGMDGFTEDTLSFNDFEEKMSRLIQVNHPSRNVFVRVSVHVNAELPGTRSRGLSTVMSAFLYDAEAIIPESGVRLKTSVWRRNPDFSIPSRAKVNGAYVNSVLARQDAIDSGYDDCIFLDINGHVAELSAANIFIVRDGVLITPGRDADVLEGINRRTVLEIAKEKDIPTIERPIDLTELYIADEAFVCGTSAFLSPVVEIDNRTIGQGSITEELREAYTTSLLNPKSDYVSGL